MGFVWLSKIRQPCLSLTLCVRGLRRISRNCGFFLCLTFPLISSPFVALVLDASAMSPVARVCSFQHHGPSPPPAPSPPRASSVSTPVKQSTVSTPTTPLPPIPPPPAFAPVLNLASFASHYTRTPPEATAHPIFFFLTPHHSWLLTLTVKHRKGQFCFVPPSRGMHAAASISPCFPLFS